MSNIFHTPAGTIFRKTVTGANGLTPYVRDYVRKENHVIEISQNYAETLFGCTVVTRNPQTKTWHKNNELSQGGFNTIQEARKYIETL